MALPGAPFPSTPLPAGRLLRRGKVRDIYDAGTAGLVIVASDRISAFDVVLSPGIPGKGVVLTQLSNFWFDTLAGVAPHHLLAVERSAFPPPYNGLAELDGRACLVRRLEIVPVECVARGYLIGSGWKEYRAGGAVCGIPLPAGLQLAARLPEPIFTPSTKADVGHDENITFEAVAGLVGADLAARLRDLTLELYRRAAALAEQRGIIIADTKFEFGVAPDGSLFLADEALTPDSSRFWPADGYRPGANPPSFDKQFVRDWLEASGWDKQPPAPALPADVIAGTQARYLEAFRRLTGRDLAL
ncbi:MAG: phosphoribosylaminoimidazolesuccinocarboxamide synthase [Acidobacteria bacterium]|nr:phosphoribosylaminoimidazolesuccinocarboxamide synthase [Acidobacteriota bacterium]